MATQAPFLQSPGFSHVAQFAYAESMPAIDAGVGAGKKHVLRDSGGSSIPTGGNRGSPKPILGDRNRLLGQGKNGFLALERGALIGGNPNEPSTSTRTGEISGAGHATLQPREGSELMGISKSCCGHLWKRPAVFELFFIGGAIATERLGWSRQQLMDRVRRGPMMALETRA